MDDRKEVTISYDSIDDQLLKDYADIVDDSKEDDVLETQDEDLDEKDTSEKDDVAKPDVKADAPDKADPKLAKQNKPSDDQAKKDAAEFYKARKEAAEAKQKAIEAETTAKAKDDFIAKMAKQAGYSDPAKFQEDAAKELSKKEAEAAGIPPEVYKQLKDLEGKVAQMEAIKLQEQQELSANRFTAALDKFVTDMGIGDKGKDQVFDRLAKAGYDNVEDILNFKNPELLIKGVMADVIATQALAKHTNSVNARPKVDSERIDTSEGGDAESWEDALAQDMLKYKQDNGF